MRTAILLSLLCISMALASPVQGLEETGALADVQEVNDLQDIDNMVDVADSEDISDSAEIEAELAMWPSGKKVAEAVIGQTETMIKKGASIHREYKDLMMSAQAHADNQARRDSIIAQGPTPTAPFNHAKASQARYGPRPFSQ